MYQRKVMGSLGGEHFDPQSRRSRWTFNTDTKGSESSRTAERLLSVRLLNTQSWGDVEYEAVDADKHAIPEAGEHTLVKKELCKQLHCCCYYEIMNLWAVEPYTKLMYSSTDLHEPIQLVREGLHFCHGCSLVVFTATYSKPCELLNHSSRLIHSTGSSTLCQGSLVFGNQRHLVAVQYSTSRRTLCQGPLLHPHSSLHPRQQLTGTSASGIPSLKDRLGQSW